MGIAVNGKETCTQAELQPAVQHPFDGKTDFKSPPVWQAPPPVIFNGLPQQQQQQQQQQNIIFWNPNPYQVPPPVDTLSVIPTATRQVFSNNPPLIYKGGFQNAHFFIPAAPMGMPGMYPLPAEQAPESPVTESSYPSSLDGTESAESSRRGSESTATTEKAHHQNETYQYMTKLPGAENTFWSEGTVDEEIQNDHGLISPKKMYNYGIHCDRMIPIKVNNNKSNMTMAPYVTNDGTVYDAVEIGERMELVWHGEFEKHFSQFFPHQWDLEPTLEAPDAKEKWKFFKDSAKVRFLCQSCGHGWTSMKGRVMFWFQFNPLTGIGHVKFRLFGQQCQTCKNGMFEHAMWYPEEVIKVIGNLFNRVGQIHYSFYRPPIRVDRRQGKPRQQHNKELCQACADNMCTEEWKFS